jgi:hypothetical protein
MTADTTATLDLPAEATAVLDLPAEAAAILDLEVSTMSVRHDITPDSLTEAGARLLHAGDDYDYAFTYKKAGAVQDLTGAKLWLTAKKFSSDADAEADLQLDSTGDIAIAGDPTTGVFTVSFKESTTKDLEGESWYDIQVLMATGKIATIAYGKLIFLPNLTRANS